MSGPPGIGKTTTCRLVAQLHGGYEALCTVHHFLVKLCMICFLGFNNDNVNQYPSIS